MKIKNRAPGFTLLELALSLSLFIGLIVVVMMTFAGKSRERDNLEEAMLRLKSLIVYASATASNTGKNVKLDCAESVILSIETDVFKFPGVFVRQSNSFTDSVNALAEVFGNSILFYPDGSKTEGQIILRSLNQDDTRKYILEITELSLQSYFAQDKEEN